MLLIDMSVQLNSAVQKVAQKHGQGRQMDPNDGLIRVIDSASLEQGAISAEPQSLALPLPP